MSKRIGGIIGCRDITIIVELSPHARPYEQLLDSLGGAPLDKKIRVEQDGPIATGMGLRKDEDSLGRRWQRRSPFFDPALSLKLERQRIQSQTLALLGLPKPANASTVMILYHIEDAEIARTSFQRTMVGAIAEGPTPHGDDPLAAGLVGKIKPPVPAR